MIDQEMVDFLTRKRDEAAAELARREATLKQYLNGEVVIATPLVGEDDDEGYGPDPIEVWGPLLKQGMSFDRDGLLEVLVAAGWRRKHTERSLSMGITTNTGTGNMILREDGKYHQTTPEERENALTLWRQKRGVKSK